MKKHREILKFIKTDLVELIRKDLWHHRIGNERDFETSLCHHLRNFVGEEEWKISTNHTISGKAASIVKYSSSGKRKRSEFIMPDITLAKNPKAYNKSLDHKIGFELKLITPARNYLPEPDKEIFQRDYRKLKKLRSIGFMRTTFFFLVFSDPKITEGKAKKKIKAVATSGGSGKFQVRVVNRYINPRTKKFISETEQAERVEKGRRVYRSYTHSDTRFQSKKGKNSTSDSGQEKAWKTMRGRVKNASWRKKYPNHSLTKEWKRKH
tara:strand:- start:62 stop:859 length:798 start_codon:yes stop_codon:yes gene_type:complete